MKLKCTYLLFGLLIGGLFVVSCTVKDNKKDKEAITYDPKWKAANEAYFFSYKDSVDFFVLHDLLANSNDSVYYKVLEAGSGVTPYFSDTVNVTYKGWTTKGWPDYPTDSIFDQTAGGRFEFSGAPFSVASGTITGWRLALQYMKVGDKWQLVIPASMGYGATKTGGIQPYSTLNFELRLISIIRNGLVVDEMDDNRDF